MALFELKNSEISIQINSFGAELKSLKKVSTNQEYMWNADPEYWKRTAPVLFPIVGSLNNGKYRYDGKEYSMSQHGFARDMEFELTKQTDDELVFELRSTEDTFAKYPFHFGLEAGYRIDGSNLIVSWKVRNCDNKEMFFSIGGHPAFMCPIKDGDKQTGYKILFDEKDTIIASVIGDHGTLSSRKKAYTLNNGYMNITADLFDEDALVVEDNQAHKVSLCNQEGEPYLTVSFDAPLFGLWSPAKKNAPFVCIEPWYSHTDFEEVRVPFEQREGTLVLKPHETFETSYSIRIW